MSREEALGVWARVPHGLTATPKRRRLALVGASAPGVLTAVIGTQVWHEPRLLGLGGALLLIALLARRHSEPRFLAWEASVFATVTPTEEPGHEP